MGDLVAGVAESEVRAGDAVAGEEDDEKEDEED